MNQLEFEKRAYLYKGETFLYQRLPSEQKLLTILYELDLLQTERIQVHRNAVHLRWDINYINKRKWSKEDIALRDYYLDKYKQCKRKEEEVLVRLSVLTHTYDRSGPFFSVDIPNSELKIIL